MTPWAEIAFILFLPDLPCLFSRAARNKNIGSELTSLYQYLLPVVATIATVLMGLESLRWTQVAAMAVIIAGMIITNLGKRSVLEPRAIKTGVCCRSHRSLLPNFITQTLHYDESWRILTAYPEKLCH